MIKVKARSGESMEGLLRRFKKMCEKEGLQKEVKRTSFYEKPSDAKRRKTRTAVKKAMQQRLKDAGLLRRKKSKKKRKKQASAAHLAHQVSL
jgi:small subunit ribosomal protein S21